MSEKTRKTRKWLSHCTEFNWQSTKKLENCSHTFSQDYMTALHWINCPHAYQAQKTRNTHSTNNYMSFSHCHTLIYKMFMSIKNSKTHYFSQKQLYHFNIYIFYTLNKLDKLSTCLPSTKNLKHGFSLCTNYIPTHITFSHCHTLINDFYTLNKLYLLLSHTFQIPFYT